MANKSVFAPIRGRIAQTCTSNEAGGAAYGLEPRHALAQVAMTGTIGGGFYQSAEAELETALTLAGEVGDLFLAQTAIHARAEGHMKDLPALLLAVLATRDAALFRAAFPRVVDNGRMVRTFVQIVRSGRTGRRSLGTAPKRMVQGWLKGASDRALLEASVGTSPSLADVIRMVHPKPASAERAALYAWLIGRPCDAALLPEPVRDLIAMRETGVGPVPDVPFRMLTNAPLTAREWAQVARRASWQTVRQGLNTFLRHGVFDIPGEAEAVAAILRDPERVRRARVLPYQIMVTAKHVGWEMPAAVVEALHEAMEIATRNVPRLDASVVVAPDVSGSMSMPVTGHRTGATSMVRCIDVAALISAALLRVNRRARVLPFDRAVREIRLEPRDTVLTNAGKLSERPGGATACSAPVAWLNAHGDAPDLVVIVSDNQSWAEAKGPGTKLMREWERLKRRNPRARLAVIDIAPYASSQACEREDVLNVGGFSDAVFGRLAAFAAGADGAGHWVREIERIEI